MFNFLKLFLIWSIRFLIGLSILTVLYAFIFDAFFHKFGYSPTDVKFFFSLFKPYSGVILLTYTIIGIYLIIEQIDVSTQSKDVRKITDWKNRLVDKLEHIKIENPLMFNHIYDNMNEIYEYLAEKQLRISNLILILRKYILKV